MVEPTASMAPAQRSFAEWLDGSCEFLAVDDLRGAEPFQIVGLLRAAGDRDARRSRGRRASPTATEPTPPTAPVTATPPLAGVRPCRSSAITASIAV